MAQPCLTRTASRPRLAQGCLVLRQSRLRLGDLVVELGGADHRKQVARLDARADIDIALNDVAACPGKDVGRFKGGRRGRQNHLVNIGARLDCSDANPRDEVALLLSGRGDFEMLAIMLLHADRQAGGEQQQGAEAEQAASHAAEVVGGRCRDVAAQGRGKICRLTVERTEFVVRHYKSSAKTPWAGLPSLRFRSIAKR